MRQQKKGACFAGVAAGVIFCAALQPLSAFGGAPPVRQPGPDVSYDEVIRDLIVNFERDNVSAQDAAVKLARLGRRAVPILSELLETNFVPDPETDPKAALNPPLTKRGPGEVPATKGNPRIAYYATVALSRMRFPETASPLLPILKSERASPELRTLAIEAAVWSTDLKQVREKSPGCVKDVEQGVEILMKIAAADGDTQVRKKALNQLSVNPDFWVRSEKLFVAALSDPDDDIRTLAAKQCWFTRIYMTSTDKLIELAEKDSVQAVRTNAMLALGRMRVRKAVPELVRIAESEANSAMQQQCAQAVESITRVPLKNNAALQKWWTEHGAAEYSKPVPAETKPGDAPQEPATK